MKVKKDELYYFLSDNIGTSAYVGIHGTAIRGDIENKYMDMTKEEKAQNIMKIGLINKRASNLTLTCNFFGILPALTENANKRKLIPLLNDSSYINSYDKGEQGQVMVVVAIPVEFIKSDNTKYFCGLIDVQSSNGHYDDPFCLSDYLFKTQIPPECIYGYYTYQNKDDKEVNFHYNESYYSRLTPKKRDEFIKKNIEESYIFRKFKGDQEKIPFESIADPNLVKIYRELIQNNPIEQFETYSKLPKIEAKTSFETKTYYTQKELESLPLLDIDLTKVKPSYEDIINGKYNIKHSVINKSIFGIQLPHRVGILLDKKQFTVSEFEEKVLSCGNTPDNLYKYWYTCNKLDFDRLYKEKIRQLQEIEKAKKSPDLFGE